MQDLTELLKGNPYPGRGIVVGKGRVYYWIMGRSSNSRNRVFELTEDGIRTKAFDESKLEDPSLIIYHPVRTAGEDLVVTNGDQTDTIVEKGFREGCMAREYEPDGPNWTPRISSVIHPDGSFELSILKHDPNSATDRCLRQFFAYESADEGGRRQPPAQLCRRAHCRAHGRARRGLGRPQRRQQGVHVRQRCRPGEALQQEPGRLNNSSLHCGTSRCVAGEFRSRALCGEDCLSKAAHRLVPFERNYL